MQDQTVLSDLSVISIFLFPVFIYVCFVHILLMFMFSTDFHFLYQLFVHSGSRFWTQLFHRNENKKAPV